MALQQDPADQASVVHYTAYTYSSNTNFCILIYNITFPAGVVGDPNTRLAHLERANRLISNDFGPNAVVFYQVTGAYTLVHRTTGAVQQWTGSFYTHVANNPSQIQGFRQFDPETFTQTSFQLLNNVEAILASNGADSAWAFESLSSVIFNVQAKINKNNEIVRTRNIRFNSRFQRQFNLF